MAACGTYLPCNIAWLQSERPGLLCQLNTAIGGQADQIFLIVGDLGTESGEGLDFINGMTFLERFFAVFDSGNSQVGLATTPFTDATTN